MLLPSKVSDTRLCPAAPAGGATNCMSPATRATPARDTTARFLVARVAANLMRCLPARLCRVVAVLLCGHRSTDPPPFDAAPGVVSWPAPMRMTRRSPAVGMGVVVAIYEGNSRCDSDG